MKLVVILVLYSCLLNPQSDRWFSSWLNFLQGKKNSCSIFSSLCFNHHNYSNQLRDSCCTIHCKNCTCGRDTLFKIKLHRYITSGMSMALFVWNITSAYIGKYIYHNFIQNCHKNACKYVLSCLNIKWFMTLEIPYRDMNQKGCFKAQSSWYESLQSLLQYTH